MLRKLERVPDPKDVQQLCYIDWTSNLLNGAQALLYHPFLPLADVSFNYKCLFERSSICAVPCPADSQAALELGQPARSSELNSDRHIYHNYVESLQSYVGNAISQLGITKPITQATPVDQESHLDLRAKLKEFMHGDMFSIIQLVVLTCVLSYYLINDVTSIIRQARPRQ